MKPRRGTSGAKKKKGGTPPKRKSTIRELGISVTSTSTNTELLDQVVKFYSKNLSKNPAAISYLKKRGLGSAELMEKFKLGFADRSLGLVLPERNRRLGKEIRQRLTEVGILRASGHEVFRGAITVPLFDQNGQVIQIYGRMVGTGLKASVPRHLWLTEEKRGLLNLEAFSSKEVIVTSSVIDAITFWNHGYKNVTAVHGVDGQTVDLLNALEHYETKKVLIAFRRNEAGDQAATQLTEKLRAAGIDVFTIELPKGLDVNAFCLKVNNPPKALAELLIAAVPVGGTKPASMAVEAAPEAQPRAPEDPATTIAPALPPAVSVTPAVKVEPAAPTEKKEDEVVLLQGERRYRVRGLANNTSFDSLKVNIFVGAVDPLNAGFHVDAFDLYSARQRASFNKLASLELGVSEETIRHDLGRVLLKLEDLQDASLTKTLEAKEKKVTLTEEETTAALAFLKSPNLLDRILTDFETCGLVGEADNKLVGYLAAVSRKLDEPLAVIIQSTSAAGKSSLMDAVLAFVPEEDRQEFSAMTGQSLYYLGENGLRNKVLAIAEQQGAAKASYALKLLQSEGELTIASTSKDENGRLVAEEYRVKGPIALLTSTTAIEIDPELQNRCVLLTVDEERNQTRAIHQRQREGQTLAGLVARETREGILRLHQNAQRLLKPLKVVNPFAPHLTFVDGQTRTRRDFPKYLTLIRSVALLHQHQRQVKTTTIGAQEIHYVEVTLADIKIANGLADRVLGRSLDSVPPHTRRLLILLEEMVKAECLRQFLKRSAFRFSRREAREKLGWSDTALKVHLRRLVELEYLVVHRGAGRSGNFELVYDGKGKDGSAFMAGLIDVGTLSHDYDFQRSGQNDQRSGCGQPLVSPRSGGGQGGENGESPSSNNGFADSEASNVENARRRDISNGESYVRSKPYAQVKR